MKRIIIAALVLSACEKITIEPKLEAPKPSNAPRLVITDYEEPCNTAQIEGLETKSLTPLVEVTSRGSTDSIWGQASPDGPIYISFCVDNDRRLRKRLKRRRTTITVTDEDGTKTTIKKGRR